jgi:anti-anti-sigma regulatory factor
MVERSDMPYLNCPGCGLTIYSAARHATSDECPRCAAPLRAVRRPPRLEAPNVGEQNSRHPGSGRSREEVSPPPASADLDVRILEAAFGTHVEVSGRLTYPLVTRLDTVLDQIDPPTKRLVVDLRAISDLDSSGLASLLAAYVRSRREDFEFLVVVPPGAPYRRIFELTRADQWLSLIEDLDGATLDRTW